MGYLRSFLMCISAFISVTIGCGGVEIPSAEEASDFHWEHVVSYGFDGTEEYSDNHSMYGEAVLKVRERAYLYMGTANPYGGEIWRTSDGENWEKALAHNGFDGDEHQDYMKYAGVFQGWLYMGSATDFREEVGAEIWRTNGDVWQQVVDNGAMGGNAADEIGDGSRESWHNREMLSSAQFEGYFYFGTGNDFIGAQMWRTKDGTRWEPVTVDGFGDTNNIEISYLIPFEGSLYAGLENKKTGAGIWRTRDGKEWEVAGNAKGGFENQNTEIHAMASHRGYLYAVTENKKGGEVWRTSDGETWECVVAGGFEGAGGDFKEAISFAGFLWVGTEGASYEEPAQIYRSATGDPGTWEDALADVPMWVGCITAFKVFKDALYVGTQSLAEIWRVRFQRQ